MSVCLFFCFSVYNISQKVMMVDTRFEEVVDVLLM